MKVMLSSDTWGLKYLQFSTIRVTSPMNSARQLYSACTTRDSIVARSEGGGELVIIFIVIVIIIVIITTHIINHEEPILPMGSLTIS